MACVVLQPMNLLLKSSVILWALPVAFGFWISSLIVPRIVATVVPVVVRTVMETIER